MLELLTSILTIILITLRIFIIVKSSVTKTNK